MNRVKRWQRQPLPFSGQKILQLQNILQPIMMGSFPLIAEPGRYLVNVTHVGYAPFYTKVFEVTASVPVSLGDLSITKQKPLCREW